MCNGLKKGLMMRQINKFKGNCNYKELNILLMLWGIKTKNSELVNFNDDHVSPLFVEKQSTKESSQSINLNKKTTIRKSIQQLIHELQYYQPFSKYVSMSNLRKIPYCQTKRYRQCVFLGQIKQNKKDGLGIMLYTNGRIYEGQWKNNYKQGKGYQKFSNSSLYDGAYIKGKPHGYGKYEWENGQIYQGQWVDGLKSGSGIWRGAKGDSYIGEWKNGKADGYGVHTWINGNRYQGQFKECLKHGQGVEKFANGDTYRGAYQNGKPHGYGEYFWSDGSSYKGEFKEGLRNGKGMWKKASDPNSDTYDGEFLNQKKQGYGVFTWSNGSKYMGNFANDVRQGYGEMYWSDGNVYKGQWNNGAQIEQISQPTDLNFQLCCNSKDLMTSSAPNYQLNENQMQLPNPEQSFDFRQFEQPNHPQIIQMKRFRARGMVNRVKNNNKGQGSSTQISGGFMICNNFVTEAVPINGGPKSPSKMHKRPSRLSFNGVSNQSTNITSSRGRIKHSQSTSERKAMSVCPYTSRLDYKSTKQIPIKNFQGVQFRQETSQHHSSSTSRSNIKVKPRVIKSSNGVRSVYNRTNHDMESFWEEVRMQKEAILGKSQTDNDQEVKWFTRSRNELKHF